MWKRFIKAMEYRSYCMAIRELRTKGLYKEAQRICEFKHNMYKTSQEIEMNRLRNAIKNCDGQFCDQIMEAALAITVFSIMYISIAQMTAQ